MDVCGTRVRAVLMQENHLIAYFIKAIGTRANNKPIYEKQ